MTNKYNRNLKLMAVIYTILSGPMYFFSPLYFLKLIDSYFIISALFATGMMTKVIMEIPTGIISDKYLGRKGTCVAGDILIFLGFICYALGQINIMFLFLGRFLFGTGAALGSGNTDALLYDVIEKSDTNKDYHYYFGKFRSYQYFYRGLIILAAGFIAYYLDIAYVVYLAILQQNIKLILGLFLKEPSNSCEIHKETKGLKFTLDAIKMFKGKAKLQLLSIINITRKIVCFAPDKFCTVFYKLYFSYFQIGILVSISLFWCSFLAKKTNKISKKFGLEKTMLFCESYSIPINLVAFGIPSPASPILMELSASSNAITQTCEGSLLQKEYDNDYRATMDSLREIIGSLFLSLSGLLIGYLADIITLEKTLLLITVIRFLVLPLYFKLLKYKKA